MHDAMSEINLTKLDDAVSSKVAPKTKNQLIFTNLAATLRQPLTDMFVLKFDLFLESLPNWAVERADALPANLQQRYMEIISSLRRERLKIEQEVVTAFDMQFHWLAQLDQSRDSKSSKTVGGLDTISLEDMALVSTEDYDVSVASDGVAGRLARALEPDLEHSFQRLKALSPKLTNISQLPYHPRSLFNVMIDSLSLLSLN